MLTTCFNKGLVGALNNTLRADVNPTASGHLTVHGESLFIEFVEVIPSRPMGHEVGVGDQNARCVFVCLEHADWFARLNQQGLVFFQITQGGDDHVEVFPSARSAADAAVNHQFVRIFSHIRVQVVHQHAQRRFGQPAFGGQFVSGCGKDVTGVLARIAHDVPFREGANTASCVRMDVRCGRRTAALLSSKVHGLVSAVR